VSNLTRHPLEAKDEVMKCIAEIVQYVLNIYLYSIWYSKTSWYRTILHSCSCEI